MSENYPSDVKLNENPNGTVSFATEVVATIAGLAATEVDGVASMISPSSGLADMFTRKSNRNLTKGVRIDLADNKVSVDITITVDYGSPVPDVARNIQENVKKAIETMSGLDVRNVDVHVTGISFEKEQRANAELDEQHRKMLEKTEEAEVLSAEPEAVEAEAAAEPETAEEASVNDAPEASEDVGEGDDFADGPADEEPEREYGGDDEDDADYEPDDDDEALE
ncbi:MAG: Asp23/Gls24 family envelope stress response protein [Clostridia bacterium]|nr:Asp23/Gls24 family envelope stress response protein [Clostridia bacterium]